ncbi:FCD domain-containing protein [Paraburkholderia sp. RL17-347-BIC-D]
MPKTCLKLNARINRLRAMTIASDDRGRQAVEEMNRILDAIRARDAQRARDAATAHVARVADIAAELLQQAVGETSV